MAVNTSIKWEASKSADTATTANKVAHSLTIQTNGTTKATFSGSAAATVNITPSSIGAAASSHTHNYLPTTGGTVTGLIVTRAGTQVFSAVGEAGEAGFVDIVTIKITNQYHNMPISFEVYRRGYAYPTKLYISFASEADTDPALAHFYYEGAATNASDFYMAKTATSTWHLYIRKSEGYDNVGIAEYYTNFNYLNAIQVSFTDKLVTNVPSGATQATLLRLPASTTAGTLTVKFNGSTKVTHNGIGNNEVNITPAAIGAAATSHTHSNYALTSHTHSNYSLTSHTHINYYPYKGELNSDSAIDNCRTRGHYNLNGGHYAVLNGGQWWGHAQVWSAPNSTANGCVNQIIMADRHMYMRQWSGSPATWSNWYRVGSPVPVLDGDYGNQTIASGNAWTSPVTTIQWSGWHLIYGCAYSNIMGMESDYGVFQATVKIAGSPWLLGNQTLNRAIGKPGVGGTIYHYLEKGTQIALRVFYTANHGKPIQVGYTYLKVFRFT